MPIRIMIVDDHKIVRDGLRAMLLGKPSIQMVAEAGNGREALDLLKVSQPDILVLDIKLPQYSGLDIARTVRKSWPQVRVLMLSANVDESYVVQSLRAGAMGFLSKDTSREEFIQAIETIFNNREYFGSNISETVIKSFVRTCKGSIADADKPLTEREIDIIKLICEGYTFKQIGEELAISPRTAETHRNNILEKLVLRNNIELVKYAIRNQIVEI